MATKIKIKNLEEGFQSIITNGKNSIVGDEPVNSGGTDLGLMPLELVLGGLALCKVATIRSAARKKGWELGEINAELEQNIGKGDKGMRTSVGIKITMENDLSEEQKEELLKIADSCFVHRMLNGEWNIEQLTK